VGAQKLRRDAGTIPARAGIGLRAKHYKEIVVDPPAVGWFEAHSENYFGEGGQPLYYLEQVRANYPLSLHGVGLSLGSTDPLNTAHLGKLKSLVLRFEPGLVSEHLSWGSVEGSHMNDLLPLPYTEEALAHVARRIEAVQEMLGRQILVENISSYVQFEHSTIPEWDFLAETARRAGCAILLDVNNIYVNSVNHGFDPVRYLEAIPVESVHEIHLAGFESNGDCLVDTHGKPVADAVWALYRHALGRFGAVPTLIEWDTHIPELPVLLGEAAKADIFLAGEDRVLVA
jgi:uncharacterized protein (UPF0276 family)